MADDDNVRLIARAVRHRIHQIYAPVPAPVPLPDQTEDDETDWRRILAEFEANFRPDLE
jgi:hypothetical protein